MPEKTIKDPRRPKDVYQRAGQWSPTDLKAFADWMASRSGTFITFDEQADGAAVDNAYPPLVFSSVTNKDRWSAYARKIGVPGSSPMCVSVYSNQDQPSPPTPGSSQPWFNANVGAVQVEFDRPRKFVSVQAKTLLLFPPTQAVLNKPFLAAFDAAGTSHVKYFSPNYPDPEWYQWQTLAVHFPQGITKVQMSCQGWPNPGEPVFSIFDNFFFSDD
jgi:hypothetical protein